MPQTPSLNRAVYVPAVLLASLACLVPMARAQNHWTGDTNSTWSESANWSGGLPGAGDEVIFGTPLPGTGAEIALGAGSLAGSLWIQDNYTFSGGDLTLTSGLIRVNLAQELTLHSLLSGTAGLTLAGGGTLRLSNTANDFSGPILLAGGSLVITNPAQLGNPTGPITVLGGNPTPGNTSTLGYTGGSLVLNGSAGGISLGYDFNLEGNGPIGSRGGALVSIGHNTLTGTVNLAFSSQTPATFRSTRISSVNGTLTLAGVLNVGGAAGTTISTLGGGINTAGAGGSYLLTGELAGTGTLEKAGAGTLFLTPSLTSSFNGRLRISGSATGGQSSVRVTTLVDALGNSVFGMANGTGTSAPIDLNGGVLEFRLDGGGMVGKNVYTRSTGSIFTGPSEGGSAINGTMTFGTLQHVVSTTAGTATTTFNSRNGNGVTFTSMAMDASSSTSTLTNTLTNNMGGDLTFTGNITLGEGNTASRPRVLAIGGNGNTVIQGSVIAGTDAGKSLTKTGTGSLTILGVGTTVAGAVNINGGAIAVTDFRSLNNNSGVINIGSSGTAGALIIGTSAAPTAAGLTTSKVINLAGSTGGASIYANQAGSNPVILNANFTATGGNTSNNKTLTLGGVNAADNIINGVIPNTGAGAIVSVTKVGSGTWVLAGANAYTGSTTISNGTLKIRANAAVSTVIHNSSAISFGVTGASAGGTLEFAGQNGVNNVEQLGALSVNAGANTLRLTPGVGGTASLVFSSLGAVSGASSLNILGSDASNTVTFSGVPDGLVSPMIYFGSSSFAYAASGVLRAAVYGVDPGFLTSAGGAGVLATQNAHWELTGNTTGSTATNIRSLRLVDSALSMGTSALRVNSQGHTEATGATTPGVVISTGNSSISASSIHTAGSGAMVFNVVDGILTLNALVHGNTTGGLTKTGEGTLRIADANNQTGATTLNQGTVQLLPGGRLSATSQPFVIRQGATLDLNGVSTAQTATTTSIGTFNGTGTITNSSATPVVFAVGGGTTGGTGTFNGVIHETNGQISVVKMGTTNSQTWNGVSNYTGSTTIGVAGTGTTGSLTVSTLADLGVNSSIGRGDLGNNAGSLIFGGTTGGLIYTGNVFDGELVVNTVSASTNRLFTIAGTGATISSNVTNNNALVWSNTGAIVYQGSGVKTLILGGTSTGDNTFNPQITNNDADVANLTKTGTGQWNLGNSNNTYTGVTTVGNGVLALNQNGALPANSPLVLGQTTTAGILQMSGLFDRNLAASAVAGSGTVTWGGTTGGGGFAAHTTPLTVAIGGLAAPSALTWGAGGFVGTGDVQSLVFGSVSALSYVDFRNAIDLGAAIRTVTVNDNTTTGADYAVLSGVLSGAGGSLLKNGNGALLLTAANTYTGTTQISAGTLQVYSLGHSSDALDTPTSVGVSGAAMTDANAIILGNGTTTGGILQYTGAGETSDRKIRLNTTTATNQIHADGSGPLILTNVANDMVSSASNRILNLRGTNTGGNMITSQLSNHAGGGALAITVDGSATWILTNGANNYTGNTTVSAGALGLGHDNALGGSTLVNSNGNVFAYGGDRTINNAVTLGNNATNGWIGDYSITFTGNNNLGAGANNVTTNNSIVEGKALTFQGGLLANSLTDNRSWTLNGTGHTIIDGDFTTSTAFGVVTTLNNGILTLGGTGASNFNKNNANTTLVHGLLRFTASNAISAAAGAGGLVFNPNGLNGNVARLDLNGTSQTVNALTATSNGTLVIDNTSASPAVFRFGANNSIVNFGAGVGSYTIQNTGAGALDIVKLGNTTATFISGITLAHAGVTASEGGGVFNIASPVTATSGLRAIGASALNLSGGITNPHLITSIEVGGGSTLSLLDGAGSVLSNLAALNLGNTGSGTVTLNLNVGDVNTVGDFLNTDSFTLLNGGTLNLGNTVTFNLTDAGLSANTTYTLLDVSAIGGGLSAYGIEKLIQGLTPGGFDAMTWFVDDNVVQLTTGDLIEGDLYWRGFTNSTWNANANNWSLNKDGSGVPLSIPGAGNTVIFAHDGVGGGALTTTLEQNFKINALIFEAGATTPSAVTINPGAPASARLEIAPQNSADGIAVTAGGPAAVTIGANLRLGANQTWNVADAGATLTLSGALFGEKNVTKDGAGRVILSGAADPTFNNGQTAVITVEGGRFELQNVAALGTAANSNLAGVVVNGGTFYTNIATASTLPNPITLAGGMLSAGGATQTYSAPVNVTAASTIHMLDPVTVTPTGRSITLAGGLTGTGDLSVDSINTVTTGNQITGTLTLNQDNSAWTGNWNILRGIVSTNHENGLGGGALITAEKGRLAFTGTAGTRTLGHDITIASATENALLELNQSSGIAMTYTGLLTLGGAGGSGELRFLGGNDAATATLTGGVLLAGNGLLGVRDAATRLLSIDSVISETGGARSLRLNDATWTGTAGTVALNAANTYTGGTQLARGTLQLGHKEALGAGDLTIAGTATVRASLDLSGAEKIANNVILNATLTATGDHSLEIGGLLTGTGADAARTLTSSLTGPAKLILNDINLGAAANTLARILTLAGTGQTDLNGLIADGNGFANGLTITNSNVTTLGGANTYSGTTTMNAAAGTLVLAGSNNSNGATTLTTGNLKFDSASNAGLAGGTLTVTAGTLEALNAARSFSNNVTWTAGTFIGSQHLTLTGALTGNTGGNRTLTNNLDSGAVLTLADLNLTNDTGTTARVFTLAGSGDTTVSGVIANAPTGVTPGATPTLTVLSTGLTVFEGANTYTGSTTLGSTTVAAGTLRIMPGSSLALTGAGAGAALTVLSGTLDLLDDELVITSLTMGNGPLGSNATVDLNGNILRMAGNFTYTASANAGTATVTAGTVNLVGNRTFTVNKSQQTNEEAVFQAVIGDGDATARNVTKAGNGTLIFEAANTYTGTTTVNNGTLHLKGSIASSGNAILNAGVTILDFEADNNAKLNSASGLVMAGGLLNVLGSSGADSAQAVNGLTLNAGASYINLLHGAGRALAFDLGDTITRNAGGTLHLDRSSGSVFATRAENTSGSILGGWATINGTHFAAVNGGVIEEFNSTAMNDVSTWQAGADITDSTGYLGGLAGNLEINSLRFAATSGSTVNLGGIANSLRISSGGILVSGGMGANSAGIAGGTLIGGGGVGTELIINQLNTGAIFEIGSRITGATILTKSGAGTLALTGETTYRGLTYLNNGTLLLANSLGLPYSSVSLRAVNGVTLDLDHGNVQVGGLVGGSSVGGLVKIGSGTLTSNTAQASRTYIGVLEGSGTFIKTGINNQVLQGDSLNFTGDVIVNYGLLQLGSTVGRLNQAASITVNMGGELHDLQDQSGSQNRIGTATVVTLNNTANIVNTAATTRGLWLQNSGQNGTRTDTIGTVVLGAGHNVIQATNTAGASGSSQIGTMTISNFLRSGHATALVRGQNLGGGSGTRGRIAPATAPDGMSGGGGLAGTANMNIVPWLIGQAGVAGTETDANVALMTGNSFVTWVSATEGLRPLNLDTEYILNAAGYNGLASVTENNVRFAANPGAALSGGSKTINSLVLDSSSTALTITGGGADTLTLASGALLATTTAAVNGITLGGFTGIQTGTGEYLVYATNAANTLTITSPLTSAAASLTKSGNGLLRLTSLDSSYSGGTWFNQGLIEVTDIAALGSGALNFQGGGLRWAEGSSFDPSVRTVTFGTGGAILDSNGNDVVIANSIGNGGAGGFGKIGAGTLTLSASADFSGNVTVAGGASAANALVFGAPGALPSTAGLILGNSLSALGGYFDHAGYVTTLAGLSLNINSTIAGQADLTFTGNVEINGAGSRTLTVNNTGLTSFNGSLFALVDRGTSARVLTLAGSGDIQINSQLVDGMAAGSLTITNTGTTTLAGHNLYTGATTLSAGHTVLDFTAANSNKISEALLTMAGSRLTLLGSGTAASRQAVAGLTLNAGAARITLSEGAGQTITFDLGEITRGTNSVIDFVFNAGSGIIGTSTTHTGSMLGHWATVNSSHFAAVSNGQVAAVVSSSKDIVSTWLAGEDVSDSNGYLGALAASLSINSLRFGAANEVSTVNIGAGNLLTIASGGLLVSPDVGTGTASLIGGVLAGAGNELLLHQNNTAAPFELASQLATTTLLSKYGEGTLLLSGFNSTREGVFISDGVLQLTGSLHFAPVTLRNGAGVVLDIAGGSTRIGGLVGGAGTVGTAVVQIGSGTLQIHNAQATRVYTGQLIGNGTLIKSGISTQELEGDSPDFTGNVIVNGGLLHLDVGAGSIRQAASITINNGGELLTDQDQSTGSVDRIGDTATVILNNNYFMTSATATNRGFWLRNENQNSERSEAIGTLLLGAGHNLVQATTSAGTDASRLATLSIGNLVRDNFATVLVRGQELGSGSGARGRITTPNEPASAVGGGGAAGTSTLSIVPWMIGVAGLTSDTTDANITAALGNTFVTWVSAVEGFRPLNLTSEYILNEAGYNALAGVTSHNLRFAVNPAAALTGGSKTINSLLLDSSAASLTMTGDAADTLTLASGALLATTSTGANTSTLGGFAALETGTSEYLIYVTNPTGRLSILPALTSGASLTKSGNGILALGNAANSYNGGTWFNQGLIEVSTLSALGSGDLNFFGGGLRWAAGATFDPSDSARKLTFNSGGAIFDTNGNDVAVANAIGNGGTGGLLKLGDGTLTLNAPVDFSGTVTVVGNAATASASSALIYGVAGALPATTNLALGNATASGFLPAFGGYFSHAGFATTLAGLNVNVSSTIVGAANLTFTGDVEIHGGGGRTLTIQNSGTTTLDGSLFTLVDRGTTARTTTIAGGGIASDITINSQIVDGTAAGSLSFTTNNGVIRLNGQNTYTGATTLNPGALGTIVVSSSQAFGLGTAMSLTSGTLMGDGSGAKTFNHNVTHGGTFIIAGDDSFTFNGTWLNSGGSRTLTVNTAGGLELAGEVRLSEHTTTARTLTLNGSGDVLVSGVISNGGGSGASSLIYSGTGTLTLASSNTHTGATSINNGVLRINAGQVLNGALNFGSANTITTAGKIEVNEDAAFGSMTVQSNSSANTNLLTIAAGKTLQINGNALIGTSAGALSTTLFNASGDGTFNVTNPAAAAQFRVGGSSGSGNVTEADFSGLAAMIIALNTTDGVIRVNSTTTTNVSGTYSLLKLAADTTFTANILAVGDGGQYNGTAGQINRLELGTGSSIFYVNTVNIGTGSRDLGSITFQHASDGTLVLRAADGVGPATFNMGTGTSTTAAALPTGNENVFDVTGHHADLLLGAVSIGTQNTRTGAMANRFAFDTGVLVMESLTMGSKTAAGNSTNVMNLGGGTVTIGSGAGTAVTLASNSGSGVVSADINITGGTVSINGNVLRGTHTGTGSANGSLLLNGGLLDLNGFSIGAAAAPIAFTWQSGTLQNLGELNGGGALVKTGTGVAELNTANTHTGATQVQGGVLRVSHHDALGSTSGGTTVASGATLALSHVAIGAEALSLAGSGAAGQNGALVNEAGDNSYGGAVTLTAASTLAVDDGSLTLGGAVNGAGHNLTVVGDGDLVLGGALTFGAGQFILNHNGFVALAGAGSQFGGGLFLNSGILRLDSAGALGVSGSLTFGGGVLRHSAGNTVDVSARFSTAASQSYRVDTNGQDVTYASALASSGGSLIKSGAGMLTLSGVNQLEAGVTVQEGTLAIASEENLGVNPATFNAAQLTLNGGTLRTTASFSIDDANRGLTLGAAGGTIETDAATHLAVANPITGPGALAKTGAGQLTLQGAHSYSGATLVSEGALFLDGATLASSAISVGAGASLGGIGSLAGDLSLGGTLADPALFQVGSQNWGAGAIIGTETFLISGTLNLDDHSIVDLYLSQTGFTRLDVGDLLISATTKFRINLIGDAGYFPAAGSAFDLLDWISLTLDPDWLISNLILPDAPVGASHGWDTSVFTSNGILALTGTATGPSIVTQPQSQTILAGDPVTFSVAIGGSEILGIEWQKGTEPIPGANGFSHSIPAVSAADHQTVYRVLLTNAEGMTTSNYATLDVVTTPRITTPLAGATVYPTVTVQLQVDAFGPGTLSYVWKKDGNPVSGAPDAPVLEITNIQAGDAGDYTVEITNSYGTTLSEVAVVAVLDPIVYDSQPQSQSAFGGTAVNLSAVVSGDGPFTYQWQILNGMSWEDITGETSANATLTLPVAAAGTTVSYRVMTSNAYAALASDAAEIEVTFPIVYDSQPQSQSAFGGTAVNLSVNVSGNGPFTYQWQQLDGAVWEDIVDETNASVSVPLPVAAAGSTLSYRVVTSNAHTSVASDAAEIGVTFPIVYDSQPQSQTVAEGNPVTLSVAVSGDAPFTYQWQQFDGGVWQDLSGETASSLSLVVPSASVGTTFQYRVMTSTTYTALASAPAVLTVADATIAITAQPQAAIVQVGGVLELSVGASGGLPMNYQWLLNGKPVVGGNHQTLVVENVSLAYAGLYSVIVSNQLPSGAFSVTSAAVPVAVVDATEKAFVVKQGATVTAKVAARSAKNFPLVYQWHVEEIEPAAAAAAIDGAVTATYKAANQQPTQRRYYATVDFAAPQTGVVPVAGGHTLVTVSGSAPEFTSGNAFAMDDAIMGFQYDFQVPLSSDADKTPASVKASGLPKGLVIDKSGRVTGTPTVTGAFTVTVTASNAGGSAVAVGSLTVNALNPALVGTFYGIVQRDPALNGNLGGLFSLTVGAKGGYSGKLTLGAKAWSFKGSFVNPGANTADIDVLVSRGTTGVPVRLTATLDADAELLSGKLEDGVTRAEDVAVEGWKRVWRKGVRQPANFAGYYTVGLDLPAALQGYVANPAIPQGTGYGSFTVNAVSGALTVAGRLADGTAFTSATTVGPNGEVALFRTLYAKNAQGSIAGKLVIDDQDDNVPASNTVSSVLEGDVSWFRPATPGTKGQNLYRAGFGPIPLNVVGAAYVAPATGVRVMGLADNGANANAAVTLAEGLIEGQLPAQLDETVNFIVSTANKAAAVADNARGMTLVINAKTGLISGKLTLLAPNTLTASPAVWKRTVSYLGMIVPDGAGGQQGLGYFLLPQLPATATEKLNTTVILSGQISLQPLP